MCTDIDVEVVLHIEEARGHGGGDEANDERSRHRRIGKGHVADRNFVLLGHNGERAPCWFLCVNGFFGIVRGSQIPKEDWK